MPEPAADRKSQSDLLSLRAVLTAVLLYALIKNIIDKPDGLMISGLFIVGIIGCR